MDMRVVKNRATSEHYTWGDACDGWRLAATSGLAVTEERMPAGAAEVRHHHVFACQVFFVLEGELDISLGTEQYQLQSGDSLLIPPGLPPEVRSPGNGNARFLVISSPDTVNDRVETGGEPGARTAPGSAERSSFSDPDANGPGRHADGATDNAVPNYDGRRFRVTSNSAAGESSVHTLFTYRQHDDLIWATYEGGTVHFGTLVGRVLPGGGLEFRYQHLNGEQQFRCGRCVSTLEILPDGRYRLRERWHWTDPPGEAGESIAEEVR